ncbi:MAG: hypothetical protein ACLF0P_07855 [Thermoanaerobaculia bacterium]
MRAAHRIAGLCRPFRSGSGLAAALLATLATPLPAAAELRVESRLEPDVIGLDGHARFTIEIEGPGYQQPRLQPRFELDNLEVVGRPDQSHDVNLGVGGESWRYSWTWTLRPMETGPAGVEDVRILVGNRELDLAPQRVDVVQTQPPDAAPPSPDDPVRRLRESLERRGRRSPDEGDGAAGDTPELFLRAEAVPERPYVRQRVLYTVYLYTRVSVRAMEARSLPGFHGVWARSLEQSGEPKKESVTWQGEPYTRVALLRKELYPLAARTLVLDPVRARFLVERIERARFSFAPVRVPVEMERESNPVTLEVRPLPAEGAPAGGPGSFTGPVGPVELQARLEPADLPVDRGATLTVVASGEGYLEALSPPALSLSDTADGLDVLGPDASPAPGTPGDHSNRCWRFLLVPRRPGSWELPALELPYFDPRSGEYRTARAEIPKLVARPRSPGASGEGPPHTIRSAAVPAPSPGAWARARKVLPWAFAVPWLAALAVMLRRRSGTGRPPPGATDAMERRLAGALEERRPRRAAAEIETAWRELVTGHLGVPEALPPSRWPDELRSRGAPREAVSELRDLLEDLHFLRFAPELSAAGALAREIVNRSRRVARVLAKAPAAGAR